jgi:membrane-bound metal-dependent hydrolase YbcI (DUF457 family)
MQKLSFKKMKILIFLIIVLLILLINSGYDIAWVAGINAMFEHVNMEVFCIMNFAYLKPFEFKFICF